MLAPVFSIAALGLTAGKVVYSDGSSLLSAAAVAYSATSPHVTIQAQNAAYVPLVVKGFAAQSANLQEWQNSAGTALTWITKDGYLGMVGTSANPSISTFANGFLFNSGATAVGFCGTHAGVTRLEAASTLRVSAGVGANAIDFTCSVNGVLAAAGASTWVCPTVATIGLVVKGFASQTANLQEWQSSAAAVYGTISENGYFTTRKASAPADAELVAGEAAFWFDSTNLLSKLMVKAKTADGTVVSGSIALA